MSRSRGSTLSRRASPRWMVPLVGVSSPAIMRSSVVFPHPDGPTSTTMRGLGTVRLKSCTATTPPGNTLRMWEKIRSDMVGEGYGRPGNEATPKRLGSVHRRPVPRGETNHKDGEEHAAHCHEERLARVGLEPVDRLHIT